MFTGIIQNLLNSSGQAQAIQRARQINNYVQTRTVQPQEIDNGLELNTFEDVMKSSLNVHTRFNVKNPDNKVKFGELIQKNVNAVNLSELNLNPYIDEDTDEISLSTFPISADKSQIKDMISKIAQKHGIDEKLVNAVIKQESGYNPNAKSSAGALGLMQLMPATAKALGVNDPYNPVQNVDGGVRYLKSMMQKYNGNLVLALAAYNAGPGNVDKYDGVPPFRETQNYVKNILANYL